MPTPVMKHDTCRTHDTTVFAYQIDVCMYCTKAEDVALNLCGLNCQPRFFTHDEITCMDFAMNKRIIMEISNWKLLPQIMQDFLLRYPSGD